ncbi:MAG: nitroreductase family protein, partial [Candidatus Micrarchaeota archaeon]
METLEAIMARHSVRDFLPKKVEHEKLVAIMAAAASAPSGMNRQPWHFLVVTDDEARRKALTANSVANNWMNNAPVIIVALADSKAFYGRQEQKTYLFDLGLAVENLLVAATDLNVATCVTIGFSADKLKKELEIPDSYVPVVLIAAGYESENKVFEPLIKGITHGINKKKSFDEVVSFEKIH